MAVIDRDEDFNQWTGKLKGKIVLGAATRGVKALFEPRPPDEDSS